MLGEAAIRYSTKAGGVWPSSRRMPDGLMLIVMSAPMLLGAGVWLTLISSIPAHLENMSTARSSNCAIVTMSHG